MKRKKTKNSIRKAERWLAKQIRLFAESSRTGDLIAETESSQNICSALTWLLSDYLQLGSTWPHKLRWLDGLTDAQLHKREDKITVYGSMVWAIAQDPGDEWAEPFEAVIKIPYKRRVDSYTIKFADDEELAKKRVSFGLYDTLAAKRVSEIPERRYRYEFRKGDGV